jgi:hypothetical protein
MDDTSVPRGKGLFRIIHANTGHPTITNIRRLAGRELDTGQRMIAAATGLLALLIGGLMAVNFAAQRHWLFVARAENWPTIIEALALDVAFVLFSALGLGLAKKGLPARSERAAAAGCAAGQAFMNYLAANGGSFHSIAAYVMPSVLLAVAADRVIAVVRRWVLGPDHSEGSAWSVAGRGLVVALVVLVKVPLYVLRVPLAPAETGKGLRRWVLNATPLPAAIEGQLDNEPWFEPWDGETCPEIVTVLLGGPGRFARCGVPLPCPDHGPETEAEADEVVPAYATKKDHLLAVYRNHPNYGERRFASRAASELAPGVGLQAGTARSYLYAELDRIEAQNPEVAS